MEPTLNTAVRRRTNRIIEQSFIALLQERPFEKITLRELCEKADINRTTFYRYYPDLFALRDQLLENLFDSLFTKIAQRGYAPAENGRNTVRDYVLEALTVVDENRNLCRLLMCNSGNGFADRLEQAITDVMHDEIAGQYSRKQEAALMSYYLAGGISGILKAWLVSDNPVDRDTLSHVIDQTIMSTYSMMRQFK